MNKKPLTIRLDAELRERLEALALSQDRSLAWVGQRAIEAGLTKLEKQSKSGNVNETSRS